MVRLFLPIVAVSLAAATPSWAVQCKSVAGHVNNTREPPIARTITIKGSQVTLSGTFRGIKSPKRTLICEKLYEGVLCASRSDTTDVTLLTNRTKAIETVTDRRTGQEVAQFSYICDGPIRMR